MAHAKRPMFYTGGGVINSGPKASQLLRELVRLTGFPITSTLMGLGAYPGLRQAVARHARHARHLRGQPRHARLRRDDRHRRALRRPHHRPHRRLLAAARKKIHIDIDPSSINKNVKVDVPIVGDVAYVLEEHAAHLEGQGAAASTRRRTRRGGSRSTSGGRRSRSLQEARSDVIMPQYAIERLYELTKDRDVYITTEVGQHQMWAAQFYPFRGAQPLDDLRRPRHHGLWPAGRHRRADGASQVAGHRHRRRRLDPDEHPGDVDGRAVSTCRSRCSSSTTSTWAWCASGSSCCTATACRTATPRACPTSSSWPRPTAASACAARSRPTSTMRSWR